MDENKVEQIIKGLNYTRDILNSITVSGIDNCQKITAVYNNIDVFLNMIANGEVAIIDTATKEKEKSQSKGGK